MAVTKGHVLATNADVFKETKAVALAKMKILQGWKGKLREKVEVFRGNMDAVNQSCDQAVAEIGAVATEAREKIEEEERRLIAQVTMKRDEKNVDTSEVIVQCEEMLTQIGKLEGRVGTLGDVEDGHMSQNLSKQVCWMLENNLASYNDVLKMNKENKISFSHGHDSVLSLLKNKQLGQVFCESDFKSSINFADNLIEITDCETPVATLKTLVRERTGIPEKDFDLTYKGDALPHEKPIHETIKGQGEEISVRNSQWAKAVRGVSSELV